MPAQGRLKPFWRELAVQLAANEVQAIKTELRVGDVWWEKTPDNFQKKWGPPIDPQELVAAKEQFKAVIARDRPDKP